MTISSTNRKAGPYTGNGISTVFPFAFKVFTPDDLRVTSADALGVVTPLAADVDFIPTLNANQDANPGGSIALTAPLAVNHTLEITSDISPTQLIDLTNQGGFYPQVISKALDKLTILIQQLITNGITSVSIGGVITGARNLGSGLGFFKAKVGEELHFRGVEAGIGISLVDTGNTIRITADGGGTGSGEANTSSNLGTGYGLAAAKSGVNLPFKSLKAGTGVTMSATADEITINSTGGGGGTWDGFANIVDFGAVADFVPAAGGLGTGTSNDTAVMAAIATGKPLYIPDGNYYVANWSTRLAFGRATVLGSSTGFVWGDTGRGKQILGNTLFVGSTNTHEISYAGGIFWAPNGSYNGIRQWTGHHNWMVLQPDAGPMQFQLYPGGRGQAITASCEAPNKLNAVYGEFDTSLLRVGMHIGWNGAVYKISAVVSSTQITVTTFSGVSPAFVTSATQRPFYCYYEYSKFVGNVSGVTVTRASGDALPYGVSGDHMFCLINGTKYDVSQGPESTGNPHTLTLTSSPGTLTGASCEFFRCYGPWAYVTLFRLQGVAGGTETNGGIALNIKNELRIFNGGTHSELFGAIKLNAPKIALGEGNGSDTLGEQLETDSDGVWLGTSSSNAGLRNGLKVYGGAIGYLPVLAARGAESDKGLGFDIPGTGKFGFTSGTYGRINFEIYCTAGSTAWATTTAGVGVATLSANSATSDADLKLAPGGSGKLIPTKIPAVSVRRSALQNIAGGGAAGSIVQWDTEIYDSHSLFSPGNPTRITVPVAGVYSVKAGIELITYGSYPTSSRTQLRILKNGTFAKAGPYMYFPYIAGVGSGSSLSLDIALAAGDYIELWIIQFSYSGGDGHADINPLLPEANFLDVHLVTAL